MAVDIAASSLIVPMLRCVKEETVSLMVEGIVVKSKDVQSCPKVHHNYVKLTAVAISVHHQVARSDLEMYLNYAGTTAVVKGVNLQVVTLVRKVQPITVLHMVVGFGVVFLVAREVPEVAGIASSMVVEGSAAQLSVRSLRLVQPSFVNCTLNMKVIESKYALFPKSMFVANLSSFGCVPQQH